MMTFLVGSILWLFAVGLILYVIHCAIKPLDLIQKSDRFYERHPHICFAVVICICAVVLYAAHRADIQNDSDIRLRLLTNNYRGMT